ncbi:vanomycin resistance protein VanB [Chloroflexus islandicus]|uniref:Vanomycin resistance protein VanB n=1 Tax=Chloroflexus islandicus TaxID=1707952 RepID=A0A178MD84_9CHLR|nr:VanW family protein [Chloroflexus islandicus]OAN45995.1 vanomycin resistance protein VanB [Chloroflexus islandicus]
MPSNRYYQEYGPIYRRRAAQREPLPGDELPPDEPRRPRTRRPLRRRRRRAPVWVWLAFVLLLVVAAPVGAVYAVDLVYPNTILPGVSLNGEPISGRSRADLIIELRQRYRAFEQQPVTLTFRDRVWQPTLPELGVAFDVERLVNDAFALGRSGDPLTRARDLWLLWREGIDLRPRLAVDLGQTQRYLLGIAPQIEQLPADAVLSLADARVIGQPSQPGTQLLVDATANDVLLAVQQLRPQTVPVRTRQLAPLIDDTDLVVAQQMAVQLLRSPIELVVEDQRIVWPPERLAELLQVKPVDGQLVIQPDTERLARAVEGLAQSIDTGTAEPRLRFSDGRVRIVAEGQPGRRLRQAEAVTAIAELLMQPDPITRTLALPVDRIEPQITAANLDSLGIVELVAEGRSSFVGSAPYRITNIRAGAARMNGVLIAPGEEFSFNRQLGEVNAANGFVEGYAIIGNRTQLEWGGGVCQVSTTVFRAAFWAGLPITERHAHSFYISWYDRFGLGPNGDGQGLDAAIFTGVQDLKFVNDTGRWLLMQTSIDEQAQVLVVQLYGTRPNRDVRIEGPIIANEVRAPSQPVYVDDPTLPRGTLRQTDVARNGRDISIYRIITDANGQERRELFFTRFRPWPNIFVRGTG